MSKVSLSFTVRYSKDKEPAVAVLDLMDMPHLNVIQVLRHLLWLHPMIPANGELRRDQFFEGTLRQCLDTCDADAPITLPYIHQEIAEAIAVFGYDPSQIDNRTSREEFLAGFEGHLRDVLLVSRALDHWKSAYREFVSAEVASEDIVRRSVYFHAPGRHGYNFITDFDGTEAPFAFVCRPITWKGISISDFYDINPETIMDQINDEMSMLIEDGDSSFCVETQSLVEFLHSWFVKHDIDLQIFDDIEAAWPSEDLLHDPELTQFIHEWNAKQNVVSHMPDMNFVVIPDGKTHTDIATELRKSIRDLETELELTKHQVPAPIKAPVGMSL